MAKPNTEREAVVVYPNWGTAADLLAIMEKAGYEAEITTVHE